MGQARGIPNPHGSLRAGLTLFALLLADPAPEVLLDAGFRKIDGLGLTGFVHQERGG
jgi:hypothetical protein